MSSAKGLRSLTCSMCHSWSQERLINFASGLRSLTRGKSLSLSKVRLVNFASGLRSLTCGKSLSPSEVRSVNFASGLRSLTCGKFSRLSEVRSVNFASGLRSLTCGKFPRLSEVRSANFASGLRSLTCPHQTSLSDERLVNTASGPMDFDPEDVVSIWPVETTFWDKVELDASLGFDYAKSTDITNFTVAVDFSHTTDNRQTEATVHEGDDMLGGYQQYLMTLGFKSPAPVVGTGTCFNRDGSGFELYDG